MPVPLRTDFTAAHMRVAAKRTKDGPQARRLLALAAIYDGGTRSDAAKIGGVTLQIVRDWVLRLIRPGTPLLHHAVGHDLIRPAGICRPG